MSDDKNFEPAEILGDLPGWVQLEALYVALNDAYHPQNPIPDHPADFVERWASTTEHWKPGEGDG